MAKPRIDSPYTTDSIPLSPKGDSPLVCFYDDYAQDVRSYRQGPWRKTVTDTVRIVAFDPGKTTGVAWWDTSPNIYATNSGLKLRIDSFSDHTFVNRYIKEAEAVIVERPFKSVAVDPIVFEVFGSIKERAHSLGKPITIQEPSITRYIKARYGLKLPKGSGKDIHGVEAFYHLLNYVEEHYPERVDEIIKLGGFTRC